MPRTARRYEPRQALHVISRFVNDEFRLLGPQDRAEVFRRAQRAQSFSDLTVVSHAGMSTHLHWTILAGEGLISPFFASLNTGLAGSLNRRQQRTGPVFAGRFKCIPIEGESLAGLIAYHHNNTVRAGLVDDPADSEWTSHLAYLREVEAPEWLDVSLGLHLCGFSDTPSGRLAFHELVLSRKDEPRNPEWSREPKRTSIVTPASGITGDGPRELAAAERNGRSADGARSRRLMQPAWIGPPEPILEIVAASCHMDVATLRSSARRADCVRARRLALRLWTEHLGRAAAEMADALGLARSTASYLLRDDPERVGALDPEAETLSEQLRRSDAA